MKIAIYSGVIPSTTFIEALIHAVAESGHHVMLFGRSEKKVKYETRNVSIYYQPDSLVTRLFHMLYYYGMFFFFKPREVVRIYKLINGERKGLRYFLIRSNQILPVLWHRPDIFHLQWAKAVHQWIFLRDFRIKLILSLRGAHLTYSPVCDPVLAAGYRQLFPMIDGFHAVSEDIKKVGLQYGIELEKVRVIYSYVRDYSTARSMQLRVKDPRVAKPLKIVSVGRFHWVKGYTYAIDALALLKDRGYEFQYRLIAAGDDEELLYLLHDAGLQDSVQIIQSVPHNVVISTIADADVLLLPSVREGIANVILEAMASGTLVVASRDGGIQEVIEHNVSGILAPIRNPEALATALENVYSLSKEAYERMTSQAKRIVEKQHSAKNFQHSFDKLYKSV